MHGKREFLISFKPGFASKQHFLKIHADTTRKAKKIAKEKAKAMYPNCDCFHFKCLAEVVTGMDIQDIVFYMQKH